MYIQRFYFLFLSILISNFVCAEETKTYLLPQKYEDNTSYMVDKSSWKLKKPEYYHRYLRFKQLYEKSITELNNNKNSVNFTIPKLMHHVWPGSVNDKIPTKFLYHIKKCQLMHPNWQHKIWYEEDILKENFDSLDLYKNSKSYAERADIMRYEILYRYGGLYLDTDVDCVKKLDQVADNFAIWFNSEPGEPLIFNGVMASYKNNSVFSDTIKIIRSDYKVNTDEVLNKYQDRRNILLLNHTLAYYRTLKPLSKAFDLNKKDDDVTLLLPSRYAVSQKIRSNSFEGVWEKFQQKLLFLSGERLFVPDYLLIHHATRLSGGLSYIMSPKLQFATKNKPNIISSWWHFRNIKNINFKKAISLLYDKNYPDNKNFSTQNILPANIFLLTDDKEQLKKWQENFSWVHIELVSKNDVDNLLRTAGFAQKFDIKTKEFLASLLLLNKRGGVVVSDGLLPKFNFLWELFYKYNSFFVFESLDKDNILRISPRILGSVAGDQIIENILAKLKNNNKIDVALIQSFFEKEITERISFISAASNSIVFPPINFFGGDKRNMSFTYEK